jgi:uncharacterized protein
MAPLISDDEIDDLLYFARIGDNEEFNAVKDELCKRENIGVRELLEAARDEQSGNGVLHMAAANGYDGRLMFLNDECLQTRNTKTESHDYC